MPQEDKHNEIVKSANMTEETDLLQRAADGDNLALESLMMRYKGLVRHKAASMYMAGADIEDIIQEGMIGLFQAIRTFRPLFQVPFSSYASQCIGARIIDAVRKASRRKHRPLNDSISLQFIQQNEDDISLLNVLEDTSETNPEHLLLEREDMRNLGDFVQNQLSKLERDVLLQYIETASYQMTAERLACSVKTVDNALDRARKKFRKYRSGKAGNKTLK